MSIKKKQKNTKQIFISMIKIHNKNNFKYIQYLYYIFNE